MVDINDVDELQLALLGLVKIGYQTRHQIDFGGVISWSNWETLVGRPGRPAEEVADEYRDYIKRGYQYQMRAVYAQKETD